MIKSWNIPKNTPFASKECGLQSHIVHSKTVHAPYIHRAMHRTYTIQYNFVWYVYGAFRGICNIFKSFWKRYLTHQLLEYSVFPCSFSKIACHNLGIGTICTVLYGTPWKLYLYNCTVLFKTGLFSCYPLTPNQA